MKFRIILNKIDDVYGYFVRVPALKGCVCRGDNQEEAIKNAKIAIEEYIKLDEHNNHHHEEGDLVVDIDV